MVYTDADLNNFVVIVLQNFKIRLLMRQLCGKCGQLKKTCFNQSKSASAVSIFGLGVGQIKWFITPQSIQSLFHFLSVCLSDIYTCCLTPSIHLMQHFTIYIHAAASLEGSLFCTTAAKHTTLHLTWKSTTENFHLHVNICGGVHASACDRCVSLLKSDG